MAKIKVHKIRGVDKNICSAEQKIAYNIAFARRDTLIRRWKECHTEFQRSEVFFDLINTELRLFRETYGEKYNLDAVFIALNQGFKNYCEKFFIARDYETIGKAFPIPYEII